MNPETFRANRECIFSAAYAAVNVLSILYRLRLTFSAAYAAVNYGDAHVFDDAHFSAAYAAVN